VNLNERFKCLTLYDTTDHHNHYGRRAGLKTYSCSTTDPLLHSIKYKLFHCDTVPIGILSIIYYYNEEKTMELRTAVSSKITKNINFDVIYKKRKKKRYQRISHLSSPDYSATYT